ncbi:hypothetical protein PFISCL1PPCAC_20097, partial [Pristionchus fissidentatus]
SLFSSLPSTSSLPSSFNPITTSKIVIRWSSPRSLSIMLHPTTFLFILLFAPVVSIVCYKCETEGGTCNEGECEGSVCIKMETSNKDNNRKTIHKTCGDEIEDVSCTQSQFGSKWTSRCVCDRPLCNGDSALVEAGLEASSSPPPPGSFSQTALLIAVLIFVGASCSILVVSTICVQFC